LLAKSSSGRAQTLGLPSFTPLTKKQTGPAGKCKRKSGAGRRKQNGPGRIEKRGLGAEGSNLIKMRSKTSKRNVPGKNMQSS